MSTQRQQLKNVLQDTTDQDLKKYLELRLIKVRRRDQEKKALAKSQSVTLGRLKLEPEQVELYKQIDLTVDYNEDYERINGENNEEE